MALKNNTWKLNQWYDQSVAGNVSYTGVNLFWGYGSNSYGGLAQNSTAVATYSSPIQISDATTWNFPPSGAGISAQSLIMTKTDGTLWSWGYNYYSILGQNSPANARLSSPTQIGGDTTWASAVMGRNNALATKTDGTLWTWGNNYRGVFGIPSYAHDAKISSPVQVPGTTWDKIYSFNVFAAATKTDGTLWTWGSNIYGILGHNQTSNQNHRSSPTQIPGTTWAHVVSGSEMKMHATKTDGSLWGWGNNYYGELGHNNITLYSSPVQVGSDTTWSLGDRKISNGDYVTHAIKTDGTLWAWGLNQYGQLGQNQDGVPTSLSSPTQIPGTTWSTVSASYTHVVSATKTDGTLWQWGGNFPNQGGAIAWPTTPTAFRSSPVQVPGTWGKVLVTRRNLLTEKVF